MKNNIILAFLFIVSLIFLYGCMETGPKNCGNDLNCFANEAKECRQSKVEWTYYGETEEYETKIDILFYFEIKGKENDACQLYLEYKDINISFSEELSSEVDESQLEEIKSELIGKFKGRNGLCKFKNEVLNEFVKNLKSNTLLPLEEVANCEGTVFEDIFS